MRTIKKLIEEVNEIKPNFFSEDIKLTWINELESSIQTEIWKTEADKVKLHEAVDEDIFVDVAHRRMYREYLCAMVDYANGEYEKYANTMQMFDSAYGEYARWYIRNYGYK